MKTFVTYQKNDNGNFDLLYFEKKVAVSTVPEQGTKEICIHLNKYMSDRIEMLGDLDFYNIKNDDKKTSVVIEAYDFETQELTGSMTLPFNDFNV